jgi:hypothetical protein
MKKMGLTEGMTNGEDTITGVSSSLTKVYNF